MAFASQGATQKFPYPAETVYEALPRAMSRAGIKVKRTDDTLRMIRGSTGRSLFSWGENVDVGVDEDGRESSILHLGSTLKLGMNFAGSHRHRKNFAKIVDALSDELRSNTR